MPRDWVIPAGHQNRKARRAARSDRRRAAWKALKAHPKGKQNFAAFVQREIERNKQPPTEKT